MRDRWLSCLRLAALIVILDSVWASPAEPRQEKQELDTAENNKIAEDGIEFLRSALRLVRYLQEVPNLYDINDIKKHVGDHLSCLQDDSPMPMSEIEKREIALVSCSGSPGLNTGAVVYTFFNTTPPSIVRRQIEFKYVALPPERDLTFVFSYLGHWKARCPTINAFPDTSVMGLTLDDTPRMPIYNNTFSQPIYWRLPPNGNRKAGLGLTNFIIDNAYRCTVNIGMSRGR